MTKAIFLKEWSVIKQVDVDSSTIITRTLNEETLTENFISVLNVAKNAIVLNSGESIGRITIDINENTLAGTLSAKLISKTGNIRSVDNQEISLNLLPEDLALLTI